jgi:hypothetical protein
MGQDKNDPQVTIDGKEYKVSEMTDQQKALLDHVMDLERKVASARFNLDQLSVGRDSFFNLLKTALEAPNPPAEGVGLND